MSEGPSRLTVTVRLEEKPLHELPELQLRKAPLSIGRILLAVSLVGLAIVAVWRLGFTPAKAKDPTLESAIEAAEPAPTMPAEQEKPMMEAAIEPASSTSTDETRTNGAAPASVVPSEAPSKPSTKPAIHEPVQAEPSTAPAPTAAVNPTTALPEGFSRIVLTAHMHNLEPGPEVGTLIDSPAIKRLYLFTELKGYAGQILEHRWYYRGELKTRATLTIEDSPWRTYSENWLLDDQQGPWRVQIVDQSQKLLFEYSFTYQ